eukprot:tig00020614_g12199.t1
MPFPPGMHPMMPFPHPMMMQPGVPHPHMPGPIPNQPMPSQPPMPRPQHPQQPQHLPIRQHPPQHTPLPPPHELGPGGEGPSGSQPPGKYPPGHVDPEVIAEQLPHGTASLVGELDKKLLVFLRDGRKLVGILRSFDQFANLVLEECHERIIVGLDYGDVPLGVYLIRGENVVLMGEIDPERDPPGPPLRRVSVKEIKQLQKDEMELRKNHKALRNQLQKLDLFDVDS